MVEMSKKNKSVIFNFGWMKLIGWFSIILFLMDFSNRTGKWWLVLIVIFFMVTSFGAVIKDRVNSKEWKEESSYSKLRNKYSEDEINNLNKMEGNKNGI